MTYKIVYTKQAKKDAKKIAQNRLVYEVIESQNTIKILRMWTHYD